MRRENKARIILLILSGFLSFCLISSFHIIFNSTSQYVSMDSFFYSLGKLSGLVGFLFLSLLIILGDTARFFDRYFGMDKIIKFQRKFALITILFVLAHPSFFILSSGNYLDYLIPDLTVVPLALGMISFYIFITVMISSILYKRISYLLWQYIHILTYVLFFFIMYHATKFGSDSGNWFMVVIYLSLLSAIVIGIIYRTHYKLKQRSNKLIVKEIKWETHDVFTLKLKTNKKLLFKPGQFCFLRLNKDKLYARHPFTISSSPSEDTLNFTMKITGKFTKIASQLKEGEEVIVDGPFGIFSIEDKNKDLIFIVGGVGVTPFMSMIRNQLDSNKQQNITLLYCIKTREDIIFKYELDKINASWFKKVFILSKEKTSDKGYECGHITTESIRKHVKDVKNSLFYVCGPEPMKNEVVKILRSMGIKKKYIKIESFFW